MRRVTTVTLIWLLGCSDGPSTGAADAASVNDAADGGSVIDAPATPADASVDVATRPCTQGKQVFTPPKEGPDLAKIKHFITKSSDGVTFGSSDVFVEGAGVPSVTAGKNQEMVAVFQWFSPSDATSYNKVGLRFSKDDGKTWGSPELLCLEGLPDDLQSPYDPTITTTAEGKYRLFFTTHKLGDMSFYYGSAISDDGVHFTYEPGERFRPTSATIVDGSAVRVGSQWFMIAPIAKQSIALDAVSSDGLTFTQRTSDRATDVHWVGNMVNASGTVRFYGGSPTNIWFSTTTNGTQWSVPKPTNIKGGDPGIALASDGTYVLIYVQPQP